MSRLISTLTAFLAISISVPGVAQMAPAGPAKPLAPLSDQADVLETLASVDPANKPRVEKEVWRLGQGTREGGMRGGHPTETEKVQIAASPAFAQAFDRAPEATLALLRWVNRDIREVQSKGGTR
jgi:hypothetical protein